MQFRFVLILSILGLLPFGLSACDAASTSADPSKGGNSDDGSPLERPKPTSYTLKTLFMLSYDQLKAEDLAGSWKDGKGEWNPGNGNSTPSLTRTVDQASLSNESPFEFKLQGKVYSERAPSFAECAFVKDLGYEPEGFKNMTVTYNLESSKLQRAVLGSSGSDPKAVRCDRFHEAPLKAHEINVVVLHDLKSPFAIYRGTDIVTPKTTVLSSVPTLKAEQHFSFTYDLSIDPTKVGSDEYTIKTSQGDQTFTPSYKACIRQFPSNSSNVKNLTSETLTLYFDDKGQLQEKQHATCCFRDGTCSMAIE